MECKDVEGQVDQDDRRNSYLVETVLEELDLEKRVASFVEEMKEECFDEFLEEKREDDGGHRQMELFLKFQKFMETELEGTLKGFGMDRESFVDKVQQYNEANDFMELHVLEATSKFDRFVALMKKECKLIEISENECKDLF